LANHWLETLGYILAAGLVLFIPGGSLLAWLRKPDPDQVDPLAALADAAALSIAILCLLALGLFFGKVQATSPALQVFYAAGVLVFVAGAGVRLAQGRSWRTAAGQAWRWLLAFALLAGLAAWRFYQANSLVLPSWVDSVHHALVVRKIVEAQGIPASLSPYFPADFFYHYGFHLITALFVHWSGQTPAQAVLWFGNVINALVALSVYRAARTILSIGPKKAGSDQGRQAGSSTSPTQPVTRVSEVSASQSAGQDRPAGEAAASMPFTRNRPVIVALLAALLTAFVLQMPAYYLTWGRYTLLSGLVLLGPALAAAWDLWQRPGRRSIGTGIKLALLVGGLCITHYFALLLCAFFLVILGLIGLAQSLRSAERRAALLQLVGWVGLGLVAASPWVWRAAIYSLSFIQVNVVNPIGQSDAALQGSMNYLQYLIYLVGPRRNHILLAVAGIGLIAALWRPNLRPFSVWALLLALLSLPWGPRLGPFRPDHFAIVLFFPSAILLGNLAFSAVDRLSRLVQPGVLERAAFRPLVLGALVVVLLVWGMRETRDVLNSATVFVDGNDLTALRWIEANVPGPARFYINSVRWQGNAYRGVDGGYWLMPYTGQSSLVPPALYVNAPGDFIDQVNQWAERAGRLKGCSADFWSLVQDAQLTHVYLHQGKGNLQPGALSSCPGVTLMYQNEKVFIYALHPGQ
jgi:hypothetical protein